MMGQMMRVVITVLQLLLIGLYRMVGSTVRVVDNPVGSVRSYHRAGYRIVFAIWHEFSVIGMYWYRRRNSGALIDDSFRGDVLAGVLRHFGITDFRVKSASGRRGTGRARSVPAFIKFIREGRDGMVAMDGPFGPSRVGKPGIIHIAGRSNAVIVPVGAYFSRAIKIRRRWDNYQIPLPWCRLHLVLGDPIEVPPDFRRRIDELLKQLTEATNRATDEARRIGRGYCGQTGRR